jgi:hypothetical protein
MSGKNLHRMSTAVLSLSMMAIGLALIAQAVSGSTHGTIVRALLGALFLAAGVGRLYLLARKSRRA